MKGKILLSTIMFISLFALISCSSDKSYTNTSENRKNDGDIDPKITEEITVYNEDDVNTKTINDLIAETGDMSVAECLKPYNKTKLLSSVTQIECDDVTLTDISFLNSLKNIETLNIKSTKIKKIDLSSHKALKTIVIKNSDFEEVILPETNSLSRISLKDNKIKSINVLNVPNLYSLDVRGNELENIEFPVDNQLAILEIASNKFREIDLSRLIYLFKLTADNNYITHLNFENNTDIKYIYASHNLIANIVIPENNALEIVFLDINYLKNIPDQLITKIKNGLKGSIHKNPLSKNTLDILNNIKKEDKLNIYYSVFEPLRDYEKLLDPESATIENIMGKVSDEGFKHCLEYYPQHMEVAEVLTIYCKDFNIKNVDLSYFVNLLSIWIPYNKVEVLDITNNRYLEIVEARNNNISEIKAKSSSRLFKVNLNNNNLSEFPSRLFENINELNLAYNKISDINLGDMLYLLRLDLESNQLFTIDSRFNENIDKINVSNNSINIIDFENNRKLNSINASNNYINQIILPENSIITNIDLSDNELSDIEFSRLVNAENIILKNNKFVEMTDILKYSETSDIVCQWGDCFKNSQILIDLTFNPLSEDSKDKLLLSKKYYPNIRYDLVNSNDE